MKNPLTQAGIEPATFRFVAQHLSHWATAVPTWKSRRYYILWMCICSLKDAACNAHAPCCHLWPVPLYLIFPYYFINGTILERKVLTNVKWVFGFSLQVLSGTLLILRRTERNRIKSYVGLQVQCRYSYPILMKLEFFSVYFRKKRSNLKFHENPSSGSRVVALGQTDRCDEVSSRFSQFSERAYKLINVLLSSTTKRLPIDTHIVVQHNKAPTNWFTYCCTAQQSAYQLIHILLSSTTKRLPLDTHIVVQHNKAPTNWYTYCCPAQQSAYQLIHILLSSTTKRLPIDTLIVVQHNKYNLAS